MLQEYLRRIGLLLVGLLVSAIGITLMLQANIGLERSPARYRQDLRHHLRYRRQHCRGRSHCHCLFLRGEFRPRYAGKYFRLPDIHRHPVVPELGPFV